VIQAVKQECLHTSLRVVREEVVVVRELICREGKMDPTSLILHIGEVVESRQRWVGRKGEEGSSGSRYPIKVCEVED